MTTSQPRWLTDEFGISGVFGRKVVRTNAARNTKAIQRIQRGTKCPLGNKKSTNSNKMVPTKSSELLGSSQGLGAFAPATPLALVFVPNVASIKATSTAIQSLDRRHIMSVLT